LQVLNPDYYAEKAQQNRIRSRPLLAPRGRIFDRDGRVIVGNQVSSTLLLLRENLKMEDLAPIADGLNLELSDLEEKVRHKSREPK
jgi:penicillin-binding protein 2